MRITPTPSGASTAAPLLNSSSANRVPASMNAEPVIEARGLTKTYRVEYPGGGDVVFDEVYAIRPEIDCAPSSSVRHGFMGIENVREVENLLRRTLLANED